MISGLAAGFLHLSQATMSVLVPDEELSPGRFVCPAQDQRDLHQHPGIFSSPLHMMLEAIKGQQILTKPKGIQSKYAVSFLLEQIRKSRHNCHHQIFIFREQHFHEAGLKALRFYQFLRWSLVK
ncbi:uncharacterized protein RBU33_019496 isoform 1-T1 [Hipposideros larvatus]